MQSFFGETGKKQDGFCEIFGKMHREM